MSLNLYWRDDENNIYLLGKLYQRDKLYHFDINFQGLKEATHHGCFGIGEINLLHEKHTSENLFRFFKRRIPGENHIKISEIMEELGMEKYDEMELLKRTKGILDTDKYFLE